MSTSLADAIVRACRDVLPERRPLALHEPVIGEAEIRSVGECLRSGWVSTAGPHVESFEAALCALTGARHAIATVNGTSALHGALLAAGIEPADEVLTPALTFVATANAVRYCGAIPHFVDSSETTLGVAPEALDRHLAQIGQRTAASLINRITGRPLRALIVMHTFGHPAAMNEICSVAERWGLVLVEDAAESLGSTFGGRHTGTLGKVGALSFNGNKIVTTGAGGAILTNIDELARRARHLCATARISAGWNFMHDEVGYNYRMPSLNAALGVAQLERLPQLLAAKRELALRYSSAFDGVAGARFFAPEERAASNHWLNTLLLDADRSELHENVLGRLNAEGLAARPAWALMHRLPMYKDCPRMSLAVAERLAKLIINLPSSPSLIRPVT
jgi:perosamine synthetase